MSFPPSVLSGLSDGLLKVDVNIVDVNGNSKNELVDIDALRVVPTIDSILAFGGNGLDLPYDLNAIEAGVSVTDYGGNVVSQTVNVPAITNNLPSLTLDPIFGEGLLNLADLVNAQTISGTALNLVSGTQLTINLTGVRTLTATVGADGKWSTSVGTDALALLQNLGNGNVTVTVSASDSVGNNVSLGGGLTLGFSQPVVTLSPLFGGDGFLNAAEALLAQTVSGVVTNAAVGSQVTVTLGSKTFQTTVGAAGAFSLILQPSDLAALADDSLLVKVEVTNASGNTGSISQTITSITKNLPTISLNSLFGGDGYLNASEATLGRTLSGTTTNAVGSTLRVTLGSRTLTTVVQSDGTCSVGLSATDLTALTDGNLTLGVSLTNPAGKNASASANVGIGIHNLPTLSLGSLFGDGYLNLAEAGVNQTISRTTSNAVGGTVSVNVGGLVLSATVAANGSWSVTVPKEALALSVLADGNLNVGVTLTDRYGNSTSTNSTAVVKTHALPQLGIDPTTLLSALSIITNGLAIHGESRNVQAGAQVSVSLLKTNSVLNGISLTGTVQADGSWTARLESSLLASLGLTVLNILAVLTCTLVSASVTDIAGNSVGVSAGLTTGISLPLTFASLESQSLAVEESGVSLETSHTVAARHETSTEHDDSTLTLASLNEKQSTGTTVTTPSDISYSIGGVAIVSADSNTLTGSDGDDVLHIDDGAGTDTLALSGEHLALDLTALGLSIDNVEIFDLGASGTNSITLDLARALSVTDKPEDDLRILGATSNEVNLIPDPSGTWALPGQRALDGMLFNVYHNSALESGNTLGDVLVQQGLHVNIV